jgi:hypothetical protein
MERHQPLATLIALFRREFESFGERGVNAALSSLSADAVLLGRVQRQFGLHARLTLIKRLAMARADKSSLVLLDRLISRSRGLQQKYDELTRYSADSTADRSKVSPFQTMERRKTDRVWLPTMIEIYDCIEEARDLQRTLQAIIGVQTGISAVMSPIGGDNHVHNATFSPAAH